MDIPNLIKSQRRKLGMTLADAAGKLGISAQYWCQVESGAKSPTLDQLLRMAKVVKLKIKLTVKP